MKPIYEPKGKAKEYGDYALNIYTGCPHRCFYCFAPNVLRRDKELFHSHVEPRPGIIEETRKQLERENITGKLIHLCFTCDPYPTGYDTSATREIIKLLKEYGNHVQILTKGDGSRDFDLLDGEDWYGITLDGDTSERRTCVCAVELQRIMLWAHNLGIKTWIAFEPVLDADIVLSQLWVLGQRCVDKVKIGKLNYYPSRIDWAKFGHEAERICQTLGLDYYIKDNLRAEMERSLVDAKRYRKDDAE